MLEEMFPSAKMPEMPLKACVVSGTAVAAYLQGNQDASQTDGLVFEPLHRASYRYGLLRTAAGGTAKRFHSMISVGSDVRTARGEYRFCTNDRGTWNLVEVAQHAGDEDLVDENTDGDVAVLFRIDLAPKRAGSKENGDGEELAMFFSPDSGNIVVELNGTPISNGATDGPQHEKNVYL
jgi:hypothetical protein